MALEIVEEVGGESDLQIPNQECRPNSLGCNPDDMVQIGYNSDKSGAELVCQFCYRFVWICTQGNLGGVNYQILRRVTKSDLAKLTKPDPS